MIEQRSHDHACAVAPLLCSLSTGICVASVLLQLSVIEQQ